MGQPDLLLPTRAAIMAALKRDAGVTGFIPKAAIYPGTVPASRAFPFARFGSMIATPFRASGLDSSAFRITVQGFTKGVTDTNGTILLPAEDHACQIGSAFKAALDDSTLTLAGGMKARLSWIQTIPVMDGDEADVWMVTSFFNVEVAG